MPAAFQQLKQAHDAALAQGDFAGVLFAGLMLPHAQGLLPNGVDARAPLPGYDALRGMVPFAARLRAAIEQRRLITFYEAKDALLNAARAAKLDALFPVAALNPPAATRFPEADRAFFRAVELGACVLTQDAEPASASRAAWEAALRAVEELPDWREELWMIRADLRRKICLECDLAPCRVEMQERTEAFLDAIGTTPLPPASPPAATDGLEECLATAAALEKAAAELEKTLRLELESTTAHFRGNWLADQHARQQTFAGAVSEFSRDIVRLETARDEFAFNKGCVVFLALSQQVRDCILTDRLEQALVLRGPLVAAMRPLDAKLEEMAAHSTAWLSPVTAARQRDYEAEKRTLARNNIPNVLTAENVARARQYSEEALDACARAQYPLAQERVTAFLSLFPTVERVNRMQEQLKACLQRLKRFDERDKELRAEFETSLQSNTAANTRRILSEMQAARKKLLEDWAGLPKDSLTRPNAPALVPRPASAVRRDQIALRRLRRRHRWAYLTLRYFFRWLLRH